MSLVNDRARAKIDTSLQESNADQQSVSVPSVQERGEKKKERK
jgi:hypothetical protein